MLALRYEIPDASRPRSLETKAQTLLTIRGLAGADNLVVMNINMMTFVAPNLACGKARGASALAPSIPHSGSVTDEQRSHRQIRDNPPGGSSFSARLRCSLLTDPLRAMLVAHASSGQKIPCRERDRIYEMDH